MTREIYEVYAKIIDANGTYNTLSGYPKAFDSRNYNDDISVAHAKAYGEWHECLGAMYKRTDRKLQVAMIIRMSDGIQIESATIGMMNEPEPEPEPAGGEE